MDNCLFLIIITTFVKEICTNICTKEFTYYDNYGYGFDITCTNLTNENHNELEFIAVSNEIQLRIFQSNLTKVHQDLFQNVANIKYLKVTNSTFTGNLNLTKVEHVSFENSKFTDLNLTNLPELKELSLINCNLTDFDQSLQKLVTLKLSQNFFRNLSLSELPALRYLDLNYNRIDNVSFLGFPNLIELNLSFNLITGIERSFPCNGLKYLNVSFNQLKNFPKVGQCLHLETLNLANNFLEKIELINVSSLRSINLSNNRIESVVLKNLTDLEELFLENNRLVTFELIQLPKLILLNLSGNNIKELFPNYFRNFFSLEMLDLSNNKILLNDFVFNLTHLHRLNLANNSVVKISRGSFHFLGNLEVLDVSSNRLTAIEDGELFTDLNRLKILNLSRNFINKIDCDVLKVLKNLQVLDISDNQLLDFPINIIAQLQLLRVIKINSNLFSCDLLLEIIKFLKTKSISFTINEKFKYVQHHLDGGYCEEMAKRTSSASESEAMQLTTGVGIFVLVLIIGSVVSFLIYKSVLYKKQRGYRLDELELL